MGEIDRVLEAVEDKLPSEKVKASRCCPGCGSRRVNGNKEGSYLRWTCEKCGKSWKANMCMSSRVSSSASMNYLPHTEVPVPESFSESMLLMEDE